MAKYQKTPVLTDRTPIREDEKNFCHSESEYKRAEDLFKLTDIKLESHREWFHWILPKRAHKNCPCRECKRRKDLRRKVGRHQEIPNIHSYYPIPNKSF